jgi:hypothetical protein
MDKNFEPGSILKQRDYTKPNQIGLIVSLLVGVLIIVVAFVIPLLK